MIRIIHNVIITLFLVTAYPIMAFLSLIAMIIRFEEFSSVKETSKIWMDTLKEVWAKQKVRV